MNKALIALLGLFGAGVIFAIIVLSMGISFHNKEVSLRNTITAKQTDNKNEMDAMWKIIDQNAQVTDEQKQALVEIFNGYAQERTGSGGGGSLMKWVQESVPNIDKSTDTYRQLMNTITSEREGFKFRQKELLDLNREHDNLITKFPGVIFASILGRHHIDITVVTSTRTEKAFQTGKDDDVSLPGYDRSKSNPSKQ